MTTPLIRVVRASPGLVWRAFEADQAVGAVTAFLRPDDRWFVAFDSCRADSYRPLLAAVGRDTGGDLRVVVEEGDDQALEQFTALGFTIDRRESNYVIPTDPALTGLRETTEPEGVVIISAVDAYEDQLRLLDEVLRQDVPGAAGWKWDPGDFHDETFSSEFDGATYLVAVGVTSGDYIGLVRVWNSPGRPRLGLVAVTRAHRRRGLARVLLGRAFGVLHGRGKPEVTAEVDDTNIACRLLLQQIGAARTGGAIELIKAAGAPAT
jgi:ribosomal protein S18 acetylase RimI-like enzyme